MHASVAGKRSGVGKSPPVRGRGLKQATTGPENLICVAQVAPRAGARIETEFPAGRDLARLAQGRPPCGGAD